MRTGTTRATPCTCCARRQEKLDAGRTSEPGDAFLPCTDRPGGIGAGRVRSKTPVAGQVLPCARCKALHGTCVDPERNREEKEMERAVGEGQ
jgi:hypothetical protein